MLAPLLDYLSLYLHEDVVLYIGSAIALSFMGCFMGVVAAIHELIETWDDNRRNEPQ